MSTKKAAKRKQPVAGRKEPAAKKGGGKHAAAGGDDVGDPEAWLADKAKREEFAARFALRELLDAAGGLVRIENFLPTAVAERVLQRVKGLDELEGYERALSDEGDAVSHAFSLAEPAGEDAVLTHCMQLLWSLLPDTAANFSVARYGSDDHISPHDDKILERYTRSEYQAMMAPYLACSPKAVPLPKELRGKGERSAVFSREVALVYYLNHDWKEADGGLFVDLQEDTPYTPDFNVLVAFRVPRMHGVTPVAGKRKARYSIFGWWLVEGELYSDEESGSDDDGDDDDDEEEEEATKKCVGSVRRKPYGRS